MQLVNPALPVTLHVVVPVGATAPVVPVTVTVNVSVELRVPPPVPTKVTVGVTFAITTLTGEVVARAV